MATVRILKGEELSPEAAEVFADIRATRGSDFVNNIWRSLAYDPPLLESDVGAGKIRDGAPRSRPRPAYERADLYGGVRGEWLPVLRPVPYSDGPGQGHDRSSAR